MRRSPHLCTRTAQDWSASASCPGAPSSMRAIPWSWTALCSKRNKVATPFHSNRMERRQHDAPCAGARTVALEPHRTGRPLRACCLESLSRDSKAQSAESLSRVCVMLKKLLGNHCTTLRKHEKTQGSTTFEQMKVQRALMPFVPCYNTRLLPNTRQKSKKSIVQSKIVHDIFPSHLLIVVLQFFVPASPKSASVPSSHRPQWIDAAPRD